MPVCIHGAGIHTEHRGQRTAGAGFFGISPFFRIVFACVPVWGICAHNYRCLQRSEEVTGSPRAEVTGGCKPANRGLGMNAGPPKVSVHI